jgi:RNA polymerase primary sigma factor
MANTQTTADTKDEAPEAQTQDGPLLDLSDAAVKKMIKEAKKRGYVTVDALNAVLPSEEVTSEQIEDIMSMLSDMGINVVESEDQEEGEPAAEEEAEEESDGRELMEAGSTAVAKKGAKKEPSDRSVELLSREGEIAIAKRIEAGREAMIAGLCESPLTFQAIIIWRDELNAANVLLRDVIDLEATYAGPDAKAPQAAVPFGAEPGAENGAADGDEPEPPIPNESDPDDEDDYENALSLAAMEAEIKPCWRPSTASPRTTRSCASCRTPPCPRRCRAARSPLPRRSG